MASKQYALSNVILPEDVLLHMGEFNSSVIEPGKINLYLDYVWHEIEVENAVDADKVITPESFNCRFFPLKDFYCLLIEFPDCDFIDAACKYSLLVVGDDISPSYFTFEYSEHVLNGERCFVVGQWVLNEEGAMTHLNYGTVDEMDKKLFVHKVYDVLTGGSADA